MDQKVRMHHFHTTFQAQPLSHYLTSSLSAPQASFSPEAAVCSTLPHSSSIWKNGQLNWLNSLWIVIHEYHSGGRIVLRSKQPNTKNKMRHLNAPKSSVSFPGTVHCTVKAAWEVRKKVARNHGNLPCHDLPCDVFFARRVCLFLDLRCLASGWSPGIS